MTENAITGIKAIVNTMYTIANGVTIPGTTIKVYDLVVFAIFTIVFAKVMQMIMGVSK